MAKDKGERRHRRTARHPECVRMMAGANFDAVPSLAEAMGLSDEINAEAAEQRRREDEVARRDLARPAPSRDDNDDLPF